MKGIYKTFNLATPKTSHKLFVFFFLLLKWSQADSIQIISPEFPNDSLKTNRSPLPITYVDGTDTLDTNINLNSGINQVVLISSSEESTRLIIDYRRMLTFTRNFPTHSLYYTNSPNLTLSYSILYLDSLSDPQSETLDFTKKLEDEGEYKIYINEKDEYGNKIADTITVFLDRSAPVIELPENWCQVHVKSDSIDLVISPLEIRDSSGIEEIKASISYYQEEKRTVLTMPLRYSQIDSGKTIQLPVVDSLTLEVQIMDKALNDTSFRHHYYKDTEGPSLAFNVSSNVFFQGSDVNIQNLSIEDPNIVDNASIIFYPGTESSKELPLLYNSTSKSYGLQLPYKLKGTHAEFIFLARDSLGNQFKSEKKQFYLQATEPDWRSKVKKRWQLIGFPRAVKTSEWMPKSSSDQRSTWQLKDGKFVFHEFSDTTVIYPGQGFLWGSYEETITFKDGWWIDSVDSIEVNKGWNIVSLGSDKIAKASNYNLEDVYKIKYIENAPAIVKVEAGDTLFPYSGYLYLHREDSVKKIKFPFAQASGKRAVVSANINITIREKISGRKVYIHSNGNTPFLSMPQGQNRFYIQESEKKWLQVAPGNISKSILLYEASQSGAAQFDFIPEEGDLDLVIVDLKTGSNVSNKEISLNPGPNAFMLLSKKEFKQRRSLIAKGISYKIINGYLPGRSQLIIQLSGEITAGFPVYLHIYNSKGIKLIRRQFFLESPSQSFLFETSRLNPGSYYFTLKSPILPLQPFQKMLVRK